MPDFFTILHEAIGTLGIVVILGGIVVGILTTPTRPNGNSRFF